MPYIFVGGSQRTGTSLVRSILSSDSKVTPGLPEIEYLRHLFSAYQAGINQFDSSLQYFFSDRAAFQQFHKSFIIGFLEQALKHYAPAKFLVLKEPHMTRVFPEIFELLGDEARFVVMVRDPRDVIVSMKEVGKKIAQQGKGHFLTEANLLQLINHYKLFYVRCLESTNKAFKQQMVFIKYEQLVTQPEPIIKHLKAFTGLTLDELDLNNPSERSVRKVGEVDGRVKPWTTELSGKAVQDTSVGQYRDKLTPEQIATIDRECSDVYQVFGYQPHS